MTTIQIRREQKNIKLYPGFAEVELRIFEHSLPGHLPTDIKELLDYTTGFTTSLFDNVDLTGRSYRFDFKELVPHGIPVAKTVTGNFWVVDVSPEGEWQNVFYISHDPLVMVIHFSSLDDFIKAVVLYGKRVIDETTSLVDDALKSKGLSVKDALSSKDTILFDFAKNLSDDFYIYDLRNQSLMRGFEWGSGPDCDSPECKRYGVHLVFAVKIPQPQKKGFFCRSR